MSVTGGGSQSGPNASSLRLGTSTKRRELLKQERLRRPLVPEEVPRCFNARDGFRRVNRRWGAR